MTPLEPGDKCPEFGIHIDNLMLDLNGIFHEAAQRVYEYGNHKKPPRLLGGGTKRKMSGLRQQIRVFELTCEKIESIIETARPKMRVIICIDGPAPRAKRSQQRQRRFRSAAESATSDCSFDSNVLTAGTKFMEYLSKYVDWYIRKRVSESARWQELEIVYSSDRVPGEGEHKCHAFGTEILQWDGSVKEVQDMTVGDIIIGDDGTPRTVTECVTGEDEMYEIIQTNADNYTVNGKHILSLRIADHKRIYWDEKCGAWIAGYYDRYDCKYKKRSFAALRDGESTFVKITKEGCTCDECNITYARREGYRLHMKGIHNIEVPKLPPSGKKASKTKTDTYNDVVSFIDTIPGDDILDITVEDYLQLNENTQKRLYGFRCPGVHWPRQKVNLDPYFLGLWLGDGVSRGPEICTVDDEITEFLQTYCVDNDFRLSKVKNTIVYRICDPGGCSRIIASMEHYNLIQNKHIPKEYLTNDKETRLKVLAGIIDTDGNVTKEGRLVRISQCLKHKQLVNDIVYLSRSLGFCVNVREENTTHTYKGEKIKGRCYQVTISGDLHTIPTLIARKKCSPPPGTGENGRSIVVDKLRTSIKIEPVGKDTYYGINTDGNHRFLLGDFTVVHNCINFMRYYGNTSETYCIHGMDADLIMLALGTHLPNFYILREDQRSTTTHCINIGQTRERLADMMKWESDEFKFSRKSVIDDFVFLCFMVGNDFLPHIPSIEIIEDGIEVILEVYKNIAPVHGHITRSPHGKVVFNKRALQAYLYTIGGYEKDILEGKLRRKNSYFPDKTLEKCARMCHTDSGESRFQLDIDRFRQEHFKASFPEGINAEQVSHDYLEGLQWVLSYYTRGVPNWDWCYPHHYAPSASIIAEYVPSFRFPTYGRTLPPPPFQQLLSVLPPKSASLIPAPLCTLLTDQSSPLKVYCPDDIRLDRSGMRQDWEAIVLLPMIDMGVMKDAYSSLINEVDERELKRNVPGKSFFYTYTPNRISHFKSFYGDIENCAVRTTPIDI